MSSVSYNYTIGSIGSILFAILASIIFWFKKYIQGGQYMKSTKMTNKVVLITGGNTGIGKATAIDLANRGAKVIIACRDSKRGETARLDIIRETGNKNVFNRKLDLASFESIRDFAIEYKRDVKRVDVLINNAGYGGPKQRTKENIEMCLGVNHIGHFLLTNLLLDNLKESAPSRIVVVSSMTHSKGCINRENFNSEKSIKGFTVYSQSKLANVLFARTLAKKLNGTRVVVNSLNPGPVDTEIFRHLPPFYSFVLKWIKFFFFKTAKSGAQTSIRLAVDPELENVTGKYFSDCKEMECGKAGQDDDTAEWLWNMSEKMTGVYY